MPVRCYHAHVYFDAGDRQQAVRLREELDRRFPVQLGRIHDRPVGPHPKPMFQALIASDDFGSVVPWLMQHRRGLDVLVHPDTGDDLGDHRDRPLWLGRQLPLRLEIFPDVAASAASA
ncbi:MAG: DOPA 4,5-dioxygenase family protein [Pseudomonadota bacterium]